VKRNHLDFDTETPVSFAAASIYPIAPSPPSPNPQRAARKDVQRRPYPSNEDATPAGLPASRRRRSRAPPPDDDHHVDAYDIATVCRKAGVGRTFVYEAINRGELIARRPSGQTRLTRILQVDYEAWIASWRRIIPAHVAGASPTESDDEPHRRGSSADHPLTQRRNHPGVVGGSIPSDPRVPLKNAPKRASQAPPPRLQDYGGSHRREVERGLKISKEQADESAAPRKLL
jgi:hypothetical protein